MANVTKSSVSSALLTSILLLVAAYHARGLARPAAEKAARQTEVQSTTSASGEIKGKAVAAETGKALASARVTAYRISPAPTVANSSTTASDGTFTISSLPTGRYGICVVDAAHTLLNPCEWRSKQTTADVTDGQVTGPVSVPVGLASTVRVRINDMASTLAPAAGEAFPPHVLVGVLEPGGTFHPAIQVKKDVTGIDYAVRIPFDTPLRLHVQSKVAKLETSTGEPISPTQGHSEGFKHDSALSPLRQPSFTFNATGKN